MEALELEEDRSWERDAACRDADIELFYREDEATEEAALQLCARCGVREQCLSVAMARREAFGIWGGTRGRDRRRLFRREARGRGQAGHHPAGRGEEDSGTSAA